MQNIKGITCDSRKVKNGYIFVAIQGLNDNGNKYIADAIDKGAVLIVTDKYQTNLNIDIPLLVVDDAREYFAQLAADFYKNPSENLKIIGTTGTNGKTTTTHLIYNMLNFQKHKSGLIGTVKVDTGKKIKKGNLTTPDSVKLQKYFKKMVDNNLQYCCMEVSSHGIKLKRIKNITFSLKIGTNITPDHLDLHQNIKKYINVKKNFLNDNSNIPVLINYDDKILKSIGKIAKNQINYSINSSTAIKAEKINIQNNKTKFEYSLKRKIPGYTKSINPLNLPIKMNLPGTHNIYNALTAITTGLYFGLKPEGIQKFFANYKGIWRRFQIIYNKKFIVIDDCAHNPGSYQAVFSTIRKLQYNNLYIINAIRGNRGVKINKENATKIAIEVQKIPNTHLLITECKDTAKKDDLVNVKEKQIFCNTLNIHNVKYEYYKKLVNAIKKVIINIGENDILLLLGAHAMDNAGKTTLKLIKNKTIPIL